jgi:hypothetical protein
MVIRRNVPESNRAQGQFELLEQAQRRSQGQARPASRRGHGSGLQPAARLRPHQQPAPYRRRPQLRHQRHRGLPTPAKPGAHTVPSCLAAPQRGRRTGSAPAPMTACRSRPARRCHRRPSPGTLRPGTSILRALIPGRRDRPRLMRAGRSVGGSRAAEDNSSDLETGFGWCDLNLSAGVRQSVVDAYLRPVLDGENLTVVTR